MRKVLLVVSITLLLFAALVFAAPTPQSPLKEFDGAVRRFNVACTSAGANQVIAGQTGYQYLVTWMLITNTSDTSDTFYLYSGSTNLWYDSSVKMTLDRDTGDGPSGISVAGAEQGPFLTESGQDLTLYITGGEDFNVVGTYRIITAQ